MLFNFKDLWEKYLPYQTRKEVAAKTVLLEEGDISQNYIFIEQGSLRAYFNQNGTDKTAQFFFESEGLASFESFINHSPSLFSIETIEPSILHFLPKKYVLQFIDDLSNEAGCVKTMFQVTWKRQNHYMQEFVSSIRDTPEQRYRNLLTDRPHIIQRVPQHYIASYLGVSTVHLSRIKSKVAKGKAHF